VRNGETCADIARRVYGKAPEALKRLVANNPGLCEQDPLPVFTPVKIPPLPPRPDKKAAAGPPRLSFVGPAVRTRTRTGWMEALPGQPIDRKTRIETSPAGGAEVSVQDKVKLQIDPNSKVVINRLPPGARAGGEVQIVEGTLHADVNAPGQGAPITVKTPSGDVRLRGDARIEAAGKDSTRVSVYEGTVAVRARGTVINIRAGQGTLILPGMAPQQPTELPTAPAWSGGEAEASRPFLVVAVGGLFEPQPRGELVVDFAPVPGAASYNVDIARDAAFNERRSTSSIEVPPLRTQLLPGPYYARVSAVDKNKLVGPPTAVRPFHVITIRTDASTVGTQGSSGTTSGPAGTAPGAAAGPGRPGGAQLMLVRTERAAVEVSGVGQPLKVRLDGGAEEDCAQPHTFAIGPGDHRIHLRLDDAEAELMVSVATPPPPAPPPVEGRIEGLDLPVPLLSPGFPGRAVRPRSRVYGLLGAGSSRADRDFTVARLDVGGELALLSNRLGFDLNVPLLYQRDLNPDPTVMSSSGLALGDITAGAKGVMLSSLQGHLLLGAMLRLQLPTGTFDRNAPESRGRPVVIDPALGLAAIVGRFGLQTTQGLTIAAAALPVTQMRWSMGYTAEVQLGRLGLVAQLDAGIGLSGNAGSGAALGGGLRVHLGDVGLLLGARGGLGESGAMVFGRYFTTLGLEWAPR
jgi:phage tail protein X